MRVELITRDSALTALRSDWNDLCDHAGPEWGRDSRPDLPPSVSANQNDLQPANQRANGVPFMRWDWLAAWWHHFGDSRQLAVVAVYDQPTTDRLVALLPCYLQATAATGRTLRFLGDGLACSDYLSVPLHPHADPHEVLLAVASWLTEPRRPHENGGESNALPWDVLELSGVAAGDPTMAALAEHLRQRGCALHQTPGASAWRINLPPTFDDYLGMLSKSHRKKMRRLLRETESAGRARYHRVERTEDLRLGMEILVDLHQRRRHSLDQTGSFDDDRFRKFITEAAGHMLAADRLRLSWLEIDAKPVAAEFQLQSGGVRYAYQSGLHPDYLEEQPGRVVMAASIREAIEEGCHAFDFCRGDEPYKANYRAEPQDLLTVRVVPPHASARIRHHAWLAKNRMKGWIKSGLQRVGVL